MAEVGFNSQNLAGISQSFVEKSAKVDEINERINSHIAAIKANWTGDTASLAGREKDFAEIDKNIKVIKENITTIAKFLEEKNTDFSQVTYK